MRYLILVIFTLFTSISFSNHEDQRTTCRLGYVQVQQDFYKVHLNFDSNSQLVNWRFVNGSPFQGRIPSNGSGYDQKPISLNPNHQLAKKYNFDSYVNIVNVGNAFFNSMQGCS